jgi:hypothetical protein
MDLLVDRNLARPHVRSRGRRDIFRMSIEGTRRSFPAANDDVPRMAARFPHNELSRDSPEAILSSPPFESKSPHSVGSQNGDDELAIHEMGSPRS